MDLVSAVREGKGGGGELISGIVAGRFEDGDAVHITGSGATLVAVHDGGGAIEEEETALAEGGGHVAEELPHVSELT